jgi:glutamine amidotransferase
VAIVDCGIGNLFSIECALKKVGLKPTIICESRNLKGFDAIVIPGVGNFKAATENIESMRSVIVEGVDDGVPLFGICLGMQLLFDSSEESPGKGLRFLRGKVLRLPESVKIPHMGWNTLKLCHHNALIDGISERDYFYFVHSYYPAPTSNDAILAQTEYGLDFASIVSDRNIYGTQFHPEKSGEAGEQILRNFASIVKRRGR